MGTRAMIMAKSGVLCISLDSAVMGALLLYLFYIQMGVPDTIKCFLFLDGFCCCVHPTHSSGVYTLHTAGRQCGAVVVN